MSDAYEIVKPRSFAAIRNVAGCMHLVTKLQKRGGQDCNVGVVHGHPGVGKTWGSIFAQIKTNGIRIRAREAYSTKDLAEDLLMELGVPRPRGTVKKLVDEIVLRLGDTPNRPLFIDEADKLFARNRIEVVRDIADAATNPVLLIGEEMLPQKLARFDRLHSRVLDWFPALLCDADDARKLADLFVPGVAISDDLLEKTRIEGGGRARRIVATLAEMREFASNQGFRALDLGNYSGDFSTGKQPEPRSGKLVAGRVA